MTMPVFVSESVSMHTHMCRGVYVSFMQIACICSHPCVACRSGKREWSVLPLASLSAYESIANLWMWPSPSSPLLGHGTTAAPRGPSVSMEPPLQQRPCRLPPYTFSSFLIYRQRGAFSTFLRRDCDVHAPPRMLQHFLPWHPKKLALELGPFSGPGP